MKGGNYLCGGGVGVCCCQDHYLKSLEMDILRSESFFMTLETAISKSSCVTCTRRSLSAYIPASVHTALISAPEAPGMVSAIFLRLMPRVRFILREWILRISRRAFSLGLGNSIFRSIRPGRRRAGSRMSIRFVHMSTLMFWVGSKP